MPKNPNGSGSDPKPPSQRVMTAVSLLATGQCSTIKDAAEKVGMHVDSLSRALKRPKTLEAINELAKKQVSALGVALASENLIDLLQNAQSEYVKADLTKTVLRSEGVLGEAETAGGGGRVQGGINLNITFAGAPAVQSPVVDVQVIEKEQ